MLTSEPSATSAATSEADHITSRCRNPGATLLKRLQWFRMHWCQTSRNQCDAIDVTICHLANTTHLINSAIE